MQIIEIIVENKKYQIEWALSEYFDKLKWMKIMCNEVAADQIIYQKLKKYCFQQWLVQ
jgi:hypothetical protein